MGRLKKEAEKRRGKEEKGERVRQKGSEREKASGSDRVGERLREME